MGSILSLDFCNSNCIFQGISEKFLQFFTIIIPASVYLIQGNVDFIITEKASDKRFEVYGYLIGDVYAQFCKDQYECVP